MNEPNGPQQIPPAYNPYLAPQSAPYHRAPSYEMHRMAGGEWVKWLYLALAVAGFAVPALLGVVIGLTGGTTAPLLPLAKFLAGALALAKLLVACVWIHLVWEALPAEVRGDVTPAGAIGRFFIPFYNLYWAFAMQSSLCNAYDLLLVQSGRRPAMPRTLAVLAPMMQLAAQVATVIATAAKEAMLGVAVVFGASVLWTFYMFFVDRVRATLADASVRA